MQAGSCLRRRPCEAPLPLPSQTAEIPAAVKPLFGGGWGSRSQACRPELAPQALHRVQSRLHDEDGWTDHRREARKQGQRVPCVVCAHRTLTWQAPASTSATRCCVHRAGNRSRSAALLCAVKTQLTHYYSCREVNMELLAAPPLASYSVGLGAPLRFTVSLRSPKCNISGCWMLAIDATNKCV